MAIEYVNEEDFSRVTAEGVWIADFYSDHCGPCKLLDVVVKEIIVDNPTLNWAKCNIEYNEGYLERFNLIGTPQLLIFVDGELKGSIVGPKDREFLEAEISRCMYGE